jgi:NADH:ubiquinone reductase (H+-translocating)
MAEHRHRVLIVGGGFGGLYAARALRRAPVEVTLVDRANHHLFQPLLYQVAAGILTEGEIAPPLRGVLRRQANARVLLAEVTDLDLDARTATAAGPDGGRLTLGYDTLVVAAGARHGYFGHPEWERLAPGLKTLEDAGRMRSRILGAFEMAELAEDPAEREAWLTFAVVGGGPTGVELSGQIADLAHRTLRADYRAIDTAAARVVLLEAGPGLLAEYPERLRARAARDLQELGVEVRVGQAASDVDAEGVTVAEPGVSRSRIRSRTVIWAAGVAASPLARLLGDASGGRLDRAGRLAVEPDLTVPGHPEVFAIGDMAALPGVPGIAPAAMQQGRHAARTIRARLAGRTAPGPFRYFDKGAMAMIGHNRAVGVSFGVRFAGLPAALVWGLVHVRYLVGWGNRLVTVVRWMWTLLARNRGERVISVSTAGVLRRLGADDALALMAGRPARSDEGEPVPVGARP